MKWNFEITLQNIIFIIIIIIALLFINNIKMISQLTKNEQKHIVFY